MVGSMTSWRWLCRAVPVLIVGCSDGAPEVSPSAGAPEVAKQEQNEPEPKAVVAEVDIGDEPLRSGKTSLAQLGQAMVDAIVANDEAALRGLAIDEREYVRLFPALVTHPGMSKMRPELAWMNQSNESFGDMQAALEAYGGKGYTFERLESTRVEPRPGLMVHRMPQLVVRDQAGQTHTLSIVGTVVEHRASQTFSVLTFAD